MRIRSITLFFSPSFPLQLSKVKKLGLQAQEIHQQITAAGYEVQTLRLATTPFSKWGLAPAEVPMHAATLAQSAKENGFDYLSIGPATIGTQDYLERIPQLIEENENLFASAEIATTNAGVSFQAVRQTAQTIQKLASLTSDGFSNLRFTALANVKAGSPFFPASYHAGKQTAFALATESADLAVDVTRQNSNPQIILAALTEQINDHAQGLEAASLRASRTVGIRYRGIDFSLAPFPESERSIGEAFQQTGYPVGTDGAVIIAALFTQAIQQARFRHTGFCGLMYPVLEDSRLAAQAAAGKLRLRDLLLYSAVCGTGLDTIPLPGDTENEQLERILLDLAALALRLNKPLTARLMPIPRKLAGDATQFNFAYFANSRVMEVESVIQNNQRNAFCNPLKLIPIHT